MSDTERRFTPWLDLVTELLATPGAGDFPRTMVEAALIVAFGCHVSWNWRTADGRSGLELNGRPDLSAAAPDLLEQWNAHGGLDQHPLMRWFAHTGDSAPMSVGRVPESVAPSSGSALLRELLAPYESEQQLSIPVHIDGPMHRAYVMARGEEDFSDEDLALAGRIQPLLQVLHRHLDALDGRGGCAAELTGRELATLHLLADGLTATAIGHRLAVSPRTVHKHLENLYRKLGVCDRLQAVLVAREAGIIGWRPAVADAAVPAQRSPR